MRKPKRFFKVGDELTWDESGALKRPPSHEKDDGPFTVVTTQYLPPGCACGIDYPDNPHIDVECSPTPASQLVTVRNNEGQLLTNSDGTPATFGSTWFKKAA